MQIESVFFELYHDLPRQGPGDNESTRKAYSVLQNLSDQASFLDVGCGSGMQTIQLAKLTEGNITAIDFHEPFLNMLRTKMMSEKFSGTITVLNKSMFDLDFPDNSFDVIWSEGSIYIYGFKKALNDWKRILKPGGYMVCSHISWLQDDPPGEIHDYWKKEYPEIAGIDATLAMIRDAEYLPVDHFLLPESSWWKNYYIPLQHRIEIIKQKYRTTKTMQYLIDETEFEIRMYKRYSSYYGYVFYIMKSPD